MQHTGAALEADYEKQLDVKSALTQQEFSVFNPPQLEVFSSPSSHFRMRAEFKIWHDKESGLANYAMHQKGVSNKPFIIQDFTIGSTTINRLMPLLLDQINQCEHLKRKLFQAEFLTSTTGEALISLIYHRPLSGEWQEKAEQLASTFDCGIIGRSRKQKIVINRDAVSETFTVNGSAYHYQQVENSFTQPNADVCNKMLNWASNAVEALSGDLLELYCGNGNFTLPLSRQFNKVLATEISKTSVNSAKYNIEKNDCNNIEIVRMSSEEFTQALNKERPFRRLKEIALEGYNFSTIFVDPPRAGLDPDTEALAARFDNILYISCNPETLKNNIEHFSKTHNITKFALFDQFPYTDHRECGVLLQKK
ncbi:tRNA (uridine(54)-C5)-methyltransferase TrmA [Teredinibacter purpureus]|uniref:tRNA (uridine(54)-C5)-methyltransferase TrmA n=1 Tax=Teredinibacter purpureus TaxID=2731756 RepID=UPI0005F7847D|nr:tRNA (uridine(54)-C5)-methyltransferase TrmA [Teredinibacter purpureus]